MLVGVGVGLVLMNVTPVGLQPGDTVSVDLASEQTLKLKVGEADKSEKLLEVSTAGGDTGTAILEKPQRRGFVTLPDGQEVDVAGVSNTEAGRRISAALGETFAKVHLVERKQVKILPPAFQPFYLVGELFIRLLKMLIVPLIIATVLIGIASLGSFKTMGRIGRQTLLLYAATMIVAAAIGITVVNIVRPGANLHWTPPSGEALAEQPAISDLLLRIVPTNPVEAMANFDVLGILFFTIMVALAMLALGKRHIAPVFNFFEGLNDLVYVLIGWVMALAPIGVGALVAYFLGIQSPELLGALVESLGKFALCVVLGLLIHFTVLMSFVKFLGKRSPLEFMRGMAPAMATAFGTDSSSATLPVTMTCVKEMGVSKRIYGFVVPVGATANMNGTALYEATAVLFFAQAYSAGLTLPQQVIVALTSMLAAVGAAGIPSAGLVTMSLVLTAVGLPLAGIGLLFAIDRPLDMMRTVVNVVDDATASVVIQAWNPEVRAEDDDAATEYQELEPGASHG